MGEGNAAKYPDIRECFLPKPSGHYEDIYLGFLGKPGGISVVKLFVDREHDSMTNFVKLWLKLRFPHVFMVYVNGKHILDSPLPSHDRKF